MCWSLVKQNEARGKEYCGFLLGIVGDPGYRHALNSRGRPEHSEVQDVGFTGGECGGKGSQRMTDSKGEVDEQEAADGDAGQRGEHAEEVDSEGRVNGYV